MPEIWIPYGGVETLVTLQAENLGTVAEAPLEAPSPEAERMAEILGGTSRLYICDSSPVTLEFLKGLLSTIGGMQGLRIFSPAPKRVESSLAELKGKVSTLAPPFPSDEEGGATYAPELMERGTKLFLGSARPDPMFGILDAKAEACLSWVARSRSVAAGDQSGMEPEPLRKTPAYDAIENLTDKIPEAKYITLVPRGGKLRTVMEDAPFDAIKNSFAKVQVSPTKGIVLGAGGRGYDDTFSSALRGIWNALDGVRRAGTVLLVAECSEGVGSTALEMLVTGRIEEGERRRNRYVDGMEEVFYLSKLRSEYDVLLLSGLPETYARSKLGLTTAKGSGEAVGRMLNKVGRTGKVNVVPRAPECLVQSG